MPCSPARQGCECDYIALLIPQTRKNDLYYSNIEIFNWDFNCLKDYIIIDNNEFKFLRF